MGYMAHDEARRALARAERDERAVGYRKAIADLRDLGAIAAWRQERRRQGQPFEGDGVVEYLESRLSSTTEGPLPPFEPLPEPARSEYEQAMRQPRTWTLEQEPGPEVKAVVDRFGQRFERGTAYNDDGTEEGIWFGTLFATDDGEEGWEEVPDLQLPWELLMRNHSPLTEVETAWPLTEVVDTDAQG